MSRLKPRRTCRACRHRFRDDYAQARTAAERERVRWQERFGMCNDCQRKRQLAAAEYIAAADRIRLAWQWTMQVYGGDALDNDPTLDGHSGPGRVVARERVSAAAERCRSLRMWR